MSRITNTFNQSRKLLIPFITAGDPNPATTVPLLHALVAAGADILELGVPFSDPMADGPVIQRASERALAQNVSLRHTLNMVQEFRINDKATPIIIMGYLNPIEIMGYHNFAVTASHAQIDGVLTVDLPPEEAAPLVAELRAVDIDPIFLLAPNSTTERIAMIGKIASGFVYYVALKGITGAATLDITSVAHKINHVRSMISLPIGVGFGIRDANSAAAVAHIADAVVVGSALVAKIENLAQQGAPVINAASSFIAELRTAIDRR